MLVQLLDGIVKLTRESGLGSVMQLPGNKVLLTRPDTGSEVLDGDRRTHVDTVATFAGFLSWAREYAAESPVVFSVSDSAAEAVSDRDNAHESDVVKLKFCRSAAFSDLLAWAESSRDIRRLVRSLRSDLAGTFPEEYLKVFRRVDFKRKNDGSRGTSHAGESMGRSVEVAAQSTEGDIPEVLVFKVPLFCNIPSPPVELRFAVEVDAVAEVVAIYPVGDCIADAIAATRDDLVDRLKGEFVGELVIDSK